MTEEKKNIGLEDFQRVFLIEYIMKRLKEGVDKEKLIKQLKEEDVPPHLIKEAMEEALLRLEEKEEEKQEKEEKAEKSKSFKLPPPKVSVGEVFKNAFISVAIMFITVALSIWVGLKLGKGLITQLFLPVAHVIDAILNHAISNFIRELLTAFGYEALIFDGDPLKLPVMLISVYLGIYICYRIVDYILDLF